MEKNHSKKYRLIREYPGSPELGSIVTLDVQRGDFGYCEENFNFSIFKAQLENYPEYWQELKEPIFTTDDNVPIYTGDVFYYVNESNKICMFPCTTMAPRNKEFVYFSTEKAAEVYVEQQKKYCTNDGEPIKRSQKFYIFDDKYYKCMEAKSGCFKSSKWHGKRYKTKEEVERLIALKKPIYSVEDIVRIVNVWSMCRVSEEDILKYIKR